MKKLIAIILTIASLFMIVVPALSEAGITAQEVLQNTTEIRYLDDEFIYVVNGSYDNSYLINYKTDSIIANSYDSMIHPEYGVYQTTIYDEESGEYHLHVYDMGGNLLVDVPSKSMSSATNGNLFEFTTDAGSGLVRKDGTIICEGCTYVEYNYEGDYFGVLKDEKAALIDAEGNFITDFVYDYIPSYANGHYIAYLNGIQVVLNENGEYLFDFPTRIAQVSYDWAIKDGVIAFYNEEEKIGYMDFDGNVLIEPQFDTVPGMTTNVKDYFWVTKDGVSAPININGEYLIEPGYGEIVSWNSDRGLVVVKNNDKHGVVDRDGNPVLDCIYEDVKIFGNNLFVVKPDMNYGIIDAAGNYVLEAEYSTGVKINNSLYALYSDDNGVLVNANGELILEGIDSNQNYGSIFLFKNGDKFAAVNASGEVIMDFIIDEVFYDSDDEYINEWLNVSVDGKWGALNTSCELVAPTLYEEVYFYNETTGNSCVKLDGTICIIDGDGNNIY